MAKQKVTISLDRELLETARALAGTNSTSATIDRALADLIHAEQIRRDVRAYTETAPTAEEVALARPATTWADLADGTDWESLYADVADATS
jgi:Post-segregation antitoxin CcdA